MQLQQTKFYEVHYGVVLNCKVGGARWTAPAISYTTGFWPIYGTFQVIISKLSWIKYHCMQARKLQCRDGEGKKKIVSWQHAGTPCRPRDQDPYLSECHMDQQLGSEDDLKFFTKQGTWKLAYAAVLLIDRCVTSLCYKWGMRGRHAGGAQFIGRRLSGRQFDGHIIMHAARDRGKRWPNTRC